MRRWKCECRCWNYVAGPCRACARTPLVITRGEALFGESGEEKPYEPTEGLLPPARIVRAEVPRYWNAIRMAIVATIIGGVVLWAISSWL